jgi:hypothetical protein
MDLPGDVELLPFPDVADKLGQPVTVVNQLLRDGKLVATVDRHGHRAVPADFVRNGVIVKGLPGVITLLRDSRYGDEEIIAWLYRDDPSLPGTPIQSLIANRGTEIKRRAQAAGF